MSRSKLIKKLDKLFSNEVKKRRGGICFRCNQIKKNADKENTIQVNSRLNEELLLYFIR